MNGEVNYQQISYMTLIRVHEMHYACANVHIHDLHAMCEEYVYLAN